MIRHIGYGLVDKNGDVVTDEDNLEFDEYLDVAKNMKRWHEKYKSNGSPYKIVRVLIDDEVGND